MAVIRNRGDFQYQAIVRRRGYEEQTRTFTTKKEAQSWAINVESEMVRAVFVSRVEAERTMLCEVIERYILEVCPKHKGATLKPFGYVRWRVIRLDGVSLPHSNHWTSRATGISG